MVAVGTTLVVWPDATYLVRAAGLAAALIGTFHLGGLLMPDPANRERALRYERALLILGLSSEESRHPGPAGGDGETERVEPDDVPRESIRPGAKASGAGPARTDRVAPAGFDAYSAASAGDAEPPVGGPD